MQNAWPKQQDAQLIAWDGWVAANVDVLLVLFLIMTNNG